MDIAVACNKPVPRSSDVSLLVVDDQRTLCTLWATSTGTHRSGSHHEIQVLHKNFPGTDSSPTSFSRARADNTGHDNMSTLDSGEQPWNCLNCKRRKVRCDRQYPCANCVKGERDCVFPTSGRIFKRAEPRVHPSGPRSRQLELMSRIRRLEKVVDDLNSELEAQPGTSRRGSPPSHDMSCDISNSDEIVASFSDPDMSLQGGDPPSATISPGQQSEGSEAQATIIRSQERSSVYVGDHFWVSLRREIRVIRETFDELSDLDTHAELQEPSPLPPNISASVSHPGFLFDHNSVKDGKSSSKELDALRPLPAEMFFIWQTFVEIVSPFVHILHIPTVEKTIHGCKGRISTLEPPMEALTFAISMSTVNAMTEEEVRTAFNRDRDEFMAQLRLGTERALSQANLLNTTSLPIIQAFILYLFTLRRYESARHIWCLVGLLVRLAVSMGLHRDGSSIPGMSPFEVEIRRRIWWHICCTEVRLNDGQVPEMGLSERDFETREPTNLDDVDISPEMTTIPAPRAGFTDTTITLIGCEKWRLTRAMQAATSKLNSGQSESKTSIEHKLEKLRSFKDRLSAECYHWQLDQPIQLVLSILSRVHANSWELVINRLKGAPVFHEGIPDEESFALALAIVKDFLQFQQNELTKRWAWLVQGNVHWQPMAIVLTRICSSPWDATSEHAWSLVALSLSLVPAVAQTDPIWRALQHLVARTHKHRTRQLFEKSRAQPIGQIINENAINDRVVGEPNISTAAIDISPQQGEMHVHEPLNLQSQEAKPQSDRIEDQIPWLFASSQDDCQGTAGTVNFVELDDMAQAMDWEGWTNIFPTQ